MSAALHERVDRALAALDCDIGPAECHGLLCGMLCASDGFDERLWLAQVSGDADDRAELPAEARDALHALAEHARVALDRDDLGFDLLLPPDDATLVTRVDGFAAWCRGFLAGLGLGGIADLSTLGEDARGFVHDLAQLGTARADAGGEDDERALAELIEFVRMGVLVVRSDTGAGDERPPPSGTRH